MPATDSFKLAEAILILSTEIRSEDGVANAAIAEGASRIRQLCELVDDYHHALYVERHPPEQADHNPAIGPRCPCRACREIQYNALDARADALGL